VKDGETRKTLPNIVQNKKYREAFIEQHFQ